jgi:hypothetical protein
MKHLTSKKIFIFWVPLAATWFMMAIEGPFLAAIIARLPDPKYNLAAFGVAFAVAILVEAPVIMIMSASTALVEDRDSFRKLRNYTYLLNAVITVVMLVVLVPPVFDFIARSTIGLPAEVATLTYGALWLLLPWPGAIGYRRFFQGILIRRGLTRFVAYGTAVRLTAMATTALILFLEFEVAGAYVGAAALSVGVSVEALASRWVARGAARETLETEPKGERLTYTSITQFYYPLALTSILALAVHPMVTFFLGRAPYSVESLAVLPVVNSLSFIFRSMGLSFQEVSLALLGRKFEHVKELGRFAIGLGLAASLALGLIGFTPLSGLWFETVSGLSHELAAFAIAPTRILSVLPFFAVMLSFQRSILMQGRFTRPITTATAVEVAGILLSLIALIHGLHLIGVTAAAIAFVVGRLGANFHLIRPCLGVLRSAQPH